MPNDAQPPEMLSRLRVYRMDDVVCLFGKSEATIHRDVRAGNFPRPIKIGRQSIAWRELDLLAWVESRPQVALPQEA